MMASEKRLKHVVHWFRKGLRLHDNPALREGICGATTVRCIFILDPWFAGSSNVGINKWRWVPRTRQLLFWFCLFFFFASLLLNRFLLQCLEDLDTSLRRLGLRLFVVRGQPANVFPKLFKEWGTTVLTFELDPEPYGRVRDQSIVTMAKEMGLEVVTKVSHTLYQLEKIIKKNGGKAPLTYKHFQNVLSGMDSPPSSEPTISFGLLSVLSPIDDDHNEQYGVPTLEELGSWTLTCQQLVRCCDSGYVYIFYLWRVQYREFETSGVAWWRERSTQQIGKTSRKEGLGCEFWSA